MKKPIVYFFLLSLLGATVNADVTFNTVKLAPQKNNYPWQFGMDGNLYALYKENNNKYYVYKQILGSNKIDNLGVIPQSGLKYINPVNMSINGNGLVFITYSYTNERNNTVYVNYLYKSNQWTQLTSFERPKEFTNKTASLVDPNYNFITDDNEPILMGFLSSTAVLKDNEWKITDNIINKSSFIDNARPDLKIAEIDKDGNIYAYSKSYKIGSMNDWMYGIFKFGVKDISYTNIDKTNEAPYKPFCSMASKDDSMITVMTFNHADLEKQTIRFDRNYLTSKYKFTSGSNDPISAITSLGSSLGDLFSNSSNKKDDVILAEFDINKTKALNYLDGNMNSVKCTSGTNANYVYFFSQTNEKTRNDYINFFKITD